MNLSHEIKMNEQKASYGNAEGVIARLLGMGPTQLQEMEERFETHLKTLSELQIP